MTPIMYRPDRKYLTKSYLQATLISIAALLISGWLGYIIGQTALGPASSVLGLILGLSLNLIWILPAFILINRYYHSLHYEIHEDEVIMHIGVITKTMKHVPYRTIINIKVKRGPFDRLFGLGTIDIQTAGRNRDGDAEESLEGLSNFKEVYNQLASAIRNS